MATIDYGFLY